MSHVAHGSIYGPALGVGSALVFQHSFITYRGILAADNLFDIIQVHFTAPEFPGRDLWVSIPYNLDINRWVFENMKCCPEFPVDLRFEAAEQLDKLKHRILFKAKYKPVDIDND